MDILILLVNLVGRGGAGIIGGLLVDLVDWVNLVDEVIHRGS